MQPMVPARRPNMISWISARNDGPDRGKVLVYKLPADTTIYGPDQIEALIDQTPEISSQITLWDQSGSKVIRGDLIVVPVGGSFVYLQPIYLQSTSSAFPQFTKIVVATPSKVVWANTLADALQKAVGPAGDAPTRDPNATPGPRRDAGARGSADRHQRPDRLRERPLRARTAGDGVRGLRDVRRGDGTRPGGARRARHASRQPTDGSPALGRRCSGRPWRSSGTHQAGQLPDDRSP